MEDKTDKDYLFSLWEQILKQAEFKNINIIDNMTAISNGLVKYHFWLWSENDNSKFIIKLSNWDDEYISKKKQLLQSKGVDTNSRNPKNAGKHWEYAIVSEMEISNDEYLKLVNMTKQHKESMIINLEKELSVKSIDINKL